MRITPDIRIALCKWPSEQQRDIATSRQTARPARAVTTPNSWQGCIAKRGVRSAMCYGRRTDIVLSHGLF